MAIRKKTTINEVAKAAGVSRQTVSRVLNNRPDVSHETRERIIKIIEQLDYHPSAIARSLITNKSYTLGVVTAGLNFAGPSRTLSGITREAEKLGYGLLLQELASYSGDNVSPFLQSFQSHHVDGIIWAAPEVGDNRDWVEDRIGEIDIPILFLTMGKKENISIVTIDNYSGSKTATEYLLGLGKKNIGHITGPMTWWEARERKRGWEDALKTAGIQPDERMWARGNWSPGKGKQAISELLDKFPQVDAIFAANDQIALSILHTAWERGINVPDELAVVGFDGIHEAEFFCPPLSTVHQDQVEMGRIAVQTIIELVNPGTENGTETSSKQITIQPELIIRQSTQS